VGDYIWNGKQVILLAWEFIPVKAYYGRGYHEILVAMMEEPSLRLETSLPDKTVSIRQGGYVFKKLQNPKWIPTLWQLVSMLRNLEGTPWRKVSLAEVNHTTLLEEYCHYKYGLVYSSANGKWIRENSIGGEK